jgi:hypothetical protein
MTARKSTTSGLTPTSKVLDADGRDWAWAFVVFRPTLRAPNWMVGTDGSVWTRWRNGIWTQEWLPRATRLNRTGYPCLVLTVDGKRSMCRVHHLVLETFIGPCPPGMEACHRDGNRENNLIGNLRWDTHSGNMADRRLRLVLKARRPPRRTPPPPPDAGSPFAHKLTASAAREIRALIVAGHVQASIARRFGVSENVVTLIKQRKIWAHVRDSPETAAAPPQ